MDGNQYVLFQTHPERYNFSELLNLLLCVVACSKVFQPGELPAPSLRLSTHEELKSLFVDAGFSRVETHAVIHKFPDVEANLLLDFMLTNPVTATLAKVNPEKWDAFVSALKDVLEKDALDRTSEAILVIADR